VNRNCLKIRLYPDRAQERELETTLETCRLVYNSLVNDRKFQYDIAQVSVGRYTQQAYLPKWKKNHPELKVVYSQVLQDVVHRVELAFKAFFERAAKGEKPGFPRFKGTGQYDSITFTQNDSFKVGDSTVRLAKIGQVKAKVHRKPWGELKTCTVRRINGKWFACICQGVEPEPLPPSAEAVGVDVGLKTFAAFSNGEGDNFFIENPRFFRKDEKALAKAQRKLSKQRRGSKERKKARKVVSRIHERIRNRRHDFCHQNARRIVNRFGVIAVEKLSVKNMLGNQKISHCLAKSIADASWSQFRSILTSKAESAGREVIAVNPAYTSQDCSGCGYRPDGLEGRTKKKLSDRWHLCPMCGLSVDRDTNAAVNILTLGQQSLASVKA